MRGRVIQSAGAPVNSGSIEPQKSLRAGASTRRADRQPPSAGQKRVIGRAQLEDLYGIDVSPDLISSVTDAVLEEVAEWQNRRLDACYPIVFFDAIRVKIRDECFVRNKAVYIALGVLPDGAKEILGPSG
jgi:hypothetical protein